MTMTIELDILSLFSQKCRRPEDFVKALKSLDIECFQDWDFTLHGLDYYLSTLEVDELTEALDLKEANQLHEKLTKAATIVRQAYKRLDNE